MLPIYQVHGGIIARAAFYINFFYSTLDREESHMEYTNLGRSGLKVSRLCLGTMNFGPQTSDEECFAIMDKALSLGINFIDTANVYGWKLGEGITETIIGHWLAQGNGRRDNIVLATKVFGRMGEGPNELHLSAYHIRSACEASLRRLNTDHIDLYQMHHIDRETPWEEIWQAMELLVQQGKVLYIGSSNFAAWNIAQAQCFAKERHFLGLASEQSLYNLTSRMVELEIIPTCRAFGLGFLPWSPLAGGLLGGSQEKRSQGRRNSERIFETFEKHRGQLEAFESLCADLSEEPAQVALAWLLSRPGVTAPIIGPRTQTQLEKSMRALEITLPPNILERLDDIWPGPGGEAPEAYAW
jgi:aryl-alcohol dehydrogenase-like predicted oxidoreductase